ncbi:MAG TPA: hypothetical protein PLQ87_09095, partial [Phycisphaerae bacterium]|nr:hypothetical protein [Phycisphaerae bacterium]
MVLFIFVIMLLNAGSEEGGKGPLTVRLLGVPLLLVFLGLLSYLIQRLFSDTGPVRFGLVPPKVVAPLVEGDTTVDVFGVSADANRVTVFANGVEIGYVTLTPPNATDTATVPVTALVAGNQITLTQTSVVGQSAKSVPVEVGKGNGDLLVCIGIRETNDTGALGTTGGTTGQIEWIGATGVSGTAPLGQALLVADSWQTFVFDPLVGPLY